jgi:hypothetical protein
MKKYDILILNELLDKYEQSKLSKEGSNRNIHISLKANHSILRDYWSEDSYLYKDQINMMLDELVRKDFISIRLSKYKELDFIDLCVESVSDIYKFLKRLDPEVDRTEVLEYLTSYVSSNRIIQEFIMFITDRLTKFQSVQTYFDNLQDLKLYIKAIEAMSSLEEDTLKRNFSKKVFNDSKLFEKIENKVLKIIREFTNEDIDDNNELLSIYHLVKTPTFAYIKGRLTIKVKDQIIDLSHYGHEIALSSSALLDFDVTEVSAKKVITIENLTTFVSFNNPEYVTVYLGGFHNSVKRKLLTKIYNYNTEIEFYHFGDIDAGGLLIFEDLVSKTNIQFNHYMMDFATLEKHRDYWMKLTPNDKKRLERMIEGRFALLVKYMIENNCKLEQEAIQQID